jgi:O-antigen ligase
MKICLTNVFLFLTILLAPLYVVRFRIGAYPSTLLEVLVGLTVGAWIVEKGRAGRLGEIGEGIREISPAVWVFLAAALTSVFISPDKHGALGIFKAYFVEPVLIYLVIKDVIRSKRNWWLVFLALALSGLWVALLAVLQGLTGWCTFAPHEAALGRVHAVYNSANAVGLYLGPIVMLLLGMVGYKLKTQNSKLKTTSQISKLRWATLLAAAAMILAIILSKSTGAVVGLAGGLGALGFLRVLGIRRGMRVLGAVGGVGAILGIWFFLNISNFTPQSVNPYVRKSTNTLQFRICLWEGTRDMLLEHPLFGAGLSGFKELYSQQYFTCDAEPLEYPHNWVLNFWTETGILGLVGFLALLWTYFKRVGGVVGVGRGLRTAFAAAMAYWLVHGLVDVPYFKNDLALEFWVIVGLVETLGLVL